VNRPRETLLAGAVSPNRTIAQKCSPTRAGPGRAPAAAPDRQPDQAPAAQRPARPRPDPRRPRTTTPTPIAQAQDPPRTDGASRTCSPFTKHGRWCWPDRDRVCSSNPISPDLRGWREVSVREAESGKSSSRTEQQPRGLQQRKLPARRQGTPSEWPAPSTRVAQRSSAAKGRSASWPARAHGLRFKRRRGR